MFKVNIKDLPFEEVLKRFEPVIKKQLLQLRIYKDHEEYYQIGRIALWHAFDRFNPERGNFSTYAISSIRGYMLNHLNKENLFNERHCFDSTDVIGNIADTGTPIEKDQLEPYLQYLSSREKTWAYETFVLGKKQQEIAADYNVSVHTVKGWRKSALAKLRKAINNGV